MKYSIHDLEVVASNPGQAELWGWGVVVVVVRGGGGGGGGRGSSTSQSKSYLNQT